MFHKPEKVTLTTEEEPRGEHHIQKTLSQTILVPINSTGACLFFLRFIDSFLSHLPSLPSINMVYKLANLTFFWGGGIHFFPDALVHVILKINTLVDLLICHLSVYFITPAIVPKRMDRKSFLPYISSVQSLSCV